MSSSSSSSASEGWRFDVFLSFCGKDVRTNFADHLYHALIGAGIRTYRDEDELPKGYKISPELITAIQESKISIPIFSKHYTSTKWCLNELVEIFKCKKTKNQVIFPIFYRIEPRDVRNEEEFLPKKQKRNEEEFNVNAPAEYNLCLHEYQKHLLEIDAEVFEKHQNNNEEKDVQQWKETVKEVGELVGWHLKEGMYERELIEEVVKTIRIELHKSRSILPENLVGIQSHIENMLDCLDIKCNDRKIIAVHGLGGIGKTTIAKVVYSKVLIHFEQHKFIEDVRDKAEKYGIEYLQNQLITDILGQEKKNITNVSDGIQLIKEKFCNKKVLIVLDDVNRSDQVESLVGNGEWFSIGSRVIITSRSMDIIVAPNQRTYEPQVMDSEDSLVLFSHYAFKADKPPIDYLDLSTMIVKTTGGLPLALRVVGSSLYSIKKRSKWENVLKKLQKFPNTDVIERLKVSYDELDADEKEIFLDIACFLIGDDKDIACYFWKGCDFFAEEGVDTLCARSLLMIDGDNKLRMHDQLRDLGRYIVREENGREAGKRSRIWSVEETFEVLDTLTGTSTIKGLIVRQDDRIPIERIPSMIGIASMTGLSLLNVIGSAFKRTLPERNSPENITNSFSNLRWLCWTAFRPSEYQLPIFHPKKLVILDLSYSEMSDEWIGWQHIKVAICLKVLKLRGCDELSRTPDVSRNRLLEELILGGCEKLKVMDKSIYYLKNLIILDMDHCNQLKDLPSEIHQLTSLKRLNLEECAHLITLPEKLGHLISLEEINLSYCGSLEELPNELCRLTALQSLKLNDCYTLQKLPEKLGCMISLTMLCISGCERLKCLLGLPSSLTSLNTSSCGLLRDISALPSSLTRLCAKNCNSLVTLSSTPGGLTNLQSLDLGNCTKLEEIEGVDEEMYSLVDFNIEDCESLKKIPKLRGSKYLKYLRTLKLDDKHFISDFGGEGMDSLEALEVLYCTSLRKIHYLPDSKSLRKLEIMRCPELSEIEHLEYYECLQELRINGATSLETLPPDLSRLKELRILEIEDCGKLTHIPGLSRLESLPESMIAGCPLIPRLSDLPNDLTSLKILGCEDLSEIRGLDRLEFLVKFNIGSCGSLERLPLPKSVKHLRISDCNNLSEICGLDRLEVLDELETLDIIECESLERLPDISNFQKLKKLKVINCEKLTEIQTVNGLMESLKILVIGGCTSLVRLSGLSNFQNLEKLNVTYCENLTDIQAGHTLKFMNMLLFAEDSKRLIINESWQLSKIERPKNDADLLRLKELRILRIFDCEQSTHIPDLSELESLRELTIADCPLIPRLSDLPNNLSSLQILRCKDLSEIVGFDGLKFLEELTIHSCESLERLHTLPENVKHLVIEGCENLTEIQGIGRLGFLERLDISACGSLKVLHLSNLQNLKNLRIANLKNPTEIHGVNGLEFLKTLNLERLPDLLNFKNLKELQIGCCKKFTEIYPKKKKKFTKIGAVDECLCRSWTLDNLDRW